MKKILWSIAIVMFLFTTGCGKQMPSHVITPEKMEEILYDYHLSISMSNGLKSDDNYKKVSYKNYVFQKHHITQADFDSSMVWYTRNTTKLAEIYSNLSERFKKEKNQLNMFLEARNSDDNIFESGDTVDIWPYGDLYWMCKKPLNNQLTFEILPDTTFHYKDAILWKANFNFLSEGEAVMGLNIHYDNDY